MNVIGTKTSYFWFITLCIILSLSSINVKAQTIPDERIKAAYTYQFAQNISWHNESLLDSFRITIYSNNQQLINEFYEIAKTKTLKQKPISVLAIKQKFKTQKRVSNIIYLDSDHNEDIQSIFKEISDKPILLITEECLLKEFVMINFIYIDEQRSKISFELNKENIEKNRSLIIQPKLLLLGGSKLDVANLYQKQEQQLKDEQEKVETQKKVLDQQSKEIDKQKKDILLQSNEIARQQNEINLQKRNLETLFDEIGKQQNEVELSQATLKINRSEIEKQQKIIDSQVEEIKQRTLILEQQKQEIQLQKNKIKDQVESLSFKEKRIETQRRFLILSISSIVLAFCLIFIILIGYRNKQIANKMLEEKNEAIEKQEKEIQLQAMQIETTNRELERQNIKLEETVKIRTEEYRLAKEKAEEADKLKSAFLANMSHEIRTPLNAIVGFSELLSCHEDINDEIKEYFDIIKQSSNDLLRLINDIIDIAKIESGQIQFSITDYNLSTEMESINRFFNDQLSLFDKNDKLTLNYQPDPDYKDLTIKADPYRLKQVIVNLLSNAIKFTDSGTIDFGYRVNHQLIEFFVKDTGIGISQEFHNSLFQRFVKLDQGDQRLYSGTGLGLAISKSLVEMHGGRIWFESIPNQGTQFYFTIPLIFGSQIPIKEEISNNYASFENKTVLICEDDDNSRELLNLILKKMNINTIISCDGIEAIEQFKKHPDIDLVLLDIQMPRLNGYKTLAELRKISNRKIPIIAQTAFAMTHEIDKILDSGFDDYISKPIIKEQLEIILSKRM